MLSAYKGKKIAVALSGGVDSLCALLLLKQAGCQVFGIHGRFFAGQETKIAKLQALCASLDVDLHIADLRDYFAEKLIRPFAEAWLKGQTPNPCVHCNREIKFGAFLSYALDLGADLIASGHYARTLFQPEYETIALAPAQDNLKDQSYFLALLPKEQLEKIIFPLACLSKEKCRQIVSAAGLVPPEAEESQDICFLGKGERHADFVAKWATNHGRNTPLPGPIRLLTHAADGKKSISTVGEHKGLCAYTIGQRRGLGVCYSEALYVLAKESGDNSLILAPRSMLKLTFCEAGQLNIFVPKEKWPKELYAKIRYRHKAMPVEVQFEDGRIQLFFKSPQFPSAEGQLGVIEDGAGLILAGGIIEKMGFEA